jgi:Protein of unknown function (DUF3999)
VKHPEITLALLVCGAACAAEPALRWNAPITVQQNATFVALPLPASAYGHSLSPGLADLRVVDATGQRVPHAWLPQPEAELQRREEPRATVAYPLPRRAAPGAALGSPVEVLVQGDSLRVRRLGGTTSTPPDSLSPGWLFDLGERKPGQPAPQMLRLEWAGPAEFAAAFDIDTSETLREWRGAGSGQVMALASPTGALVQRDVLLPPGVPRFVRLVWRGTATAPQITAAQAISVQQTPGAQERAEAVTVQPGPEPAGKSPPPANALHFDLGGNLPLSAVDLRLPAGTRVAPVRLQARQRSDEAWRELGSWVFYRLEREGTSSPSPAFAVQTTARYLRVLPDERAGALDPGATQLVVQAHLARLVFASQGQPPYRLLAGAADASNGALPIATLVPQLNEEIPRLGRAQLGAWAEVAAVAQQAAAAERQAALRPWLLWAVLLAGVAGLGAMVWKLARGTPDSADIKPGAGPPS